MKARRGFQVKGWCSLAAQRVAHFSNCLKVGGKGNTGQVSESQMGVVIQKTAGEAEKAKPMYFIIYLFSAKPPSIIPGLCFPFCHFSIILSISVGLLSLGCFLFSCFPIFHYLHFFLFKLFYNRARRMWKPSYNMTHKLQCHNCSYLVSPPGVCRSRSGWRGRSGGQGKEGKDL